MSSTKNTKKIDTLTLTPSQASAAIERCIKMKMPAFIWGAPGIGKSQIIKQIAKKLGYEFVDIRLTQMDPTDLRGMPYPVEENGRKGMRWAPPSLFSTDPDAKVIYLLDELNTAPQSVQASAYQLVLDRKVGEYELPRGCVVLAAGNREGDKGATFRMPTPLANRFIHLEMTHNFDDWNEWALDNYIHKDVVGYLNSFKQELFTFDPISASKAFATPRSWEFVSRLLASEEELSDRVMLSLVTGAVGDGIAVKFMEYRKNTATLPKPADVLGGIVKELKTKEISTMYALVISLCYELRETYTKWQEADKTDKEKLLKKFNLYSDNFFGFMLENMSAELCVLGARTAMAVQKVKFNTKDLANWKNFSDRYKNLIVRA